MPTNRRVSKDVAKRRLGLFDVARHVDLRRRAEEVQKRTLTTLRSSRGAGVSAVTRAAQVPQKRKPSRFSFRNSDMSPWAKAYDGAALPCEFPLRRAPAAAVRAA